jgi:trimethylamine--corrinoid protein Co-methyltransferase
MIYGLGLLEGGLTWDYATLVMQNEFCRQIMHCIKGIPVNDNKMAMEVVREVGPGGEFISHEHTYENFKELSKTELIDRHNRDGWMAAGGKDIVERSYEKAIDLLENHKNPSPLPENIQKQLQEIVKEAEAETSEIKAKEKENAGKPTKF